MNDLARTQPASTTSSETDEAAAGARIFTGNLFRIRDGRGWAFTEAPPAPPPPQVRRPARVAQALARAHRLEAAIAAGDYADRADVARQLGFTRARITQILDLVLLAPDIQERILDLWTNGGREPLTERPLRNVAGISSWRDQRSAWARLLAARQVQECP